MITSGAAHPPGRRTDDEERLARVAWSIMAEPTDPVALWARARLGPVAALVLAREASPDAALASLVDGPPAPADRERVRAALERWRARVARTDPARVLDAALKRGMRVLIPGDPDWPAGLLDLGGTAPHCLWVHGPGDLSSLTGGSGAVALVGSRASSAYGEDCASAIAASVADRGVCVISGGAYGIDAAAHRGALAAPGPGGTVAVLAGGLDSLYPRGNTSLLEAIRERHVLVSEAPLGTAPTRWRFLARNRLIAALSGACVVIEASWRSGALSTARHADELSRPVGAVPGPVTSASSAGCHRLIRERGAVLVTDAAEVIDLMRGGEAAGESRFAVQDELDLLAPEDRRVLDGVPPRSAISELDLALVCALPEPAVTAALARLELFGAIERTAAGIRRVRPVRP